MPGAFSILAYLPGQPPGIAPGDRLHHGGSTRRDGESRGLSASIHVGRGSRPVVSAWCRDGIRPGGRPGDGGLPAGARNGIQGSATTNCRCEIAAERMETGRVPRPIGRKGLAHRPFCARCGLGCGSCRGILRGVEAVWGIVGASGEASAPICRGIPGDCNSTQD